MRDPALTLLRLELDRIEYRRSQPPSVRIRAMHPDYSPADKVDVVVEVKATDSDPQAKPLKHLETTTNQDGEAHVDLGLLAPGAYRVVGRATLDGRAVTEDRTFVVRAEGRELEDVAFRDKVLRDIADASRGSYQAGELGNIAIAEPREVRVGRQRSSNWSSPIFSASACAAVTSVFAAQAGHS